MKKFTITALFITSSALVDIAHAQSVVEAINNFQLDFDTKHKHFMTEVYNPKRILQPINPPSSSIIYEPYLQNIQNANSDTTSSLSSTYALDATSYNLNNALTEFPYTLQKKAHQSLSQIEGDQSLSQQQKAAEAFESLLGSGEATDAIEAIEQESPGNPTNIPFGQYRSKYSTSKLITDSTAAASDTLYSTNNQILSAKGSGSLPNGQSELITQPGTLYNDNLNFAALFEPIVYKNASSGNNQKPSISNPTWMTAKNYLVYAAQSTQNLSAGLNLNSLKNHPHALYLLKNDPNYLEFAMAIRNLLAIKSITIDNLEYLIGERTRQPKLGKDINNPNKDNSASPLQVEEYQANQRIRDKNWYNSIMNDAPITVQRTIAIELAEIEHQNYQAHLDRERILAALTANSMQASSSAGVMIKQQISTINSDIKSFIPKQKKLKSDADSTPQKTKGS